MNYLASVRDQIKFYHKYKEDVNLYFLYFAKITGMEEETGDFSHHYSLLFL